MAHYTVAQCEELLATVFPRWVMDLDIRVERSEERRVVLRLPAATPIERIGGIVCGQALMAFADTAMIVAVISHLGEFVPVATVSQTTNFLSGAGDGDITADVRLTKTGRMLVFAEADMVSGEPAQPVARISGVIALPPRKPGRLPPEAYGA
jgi:acyl-coenzyme A thioesterase PaaI-like protein